MKKQFLFFTLPLVAVLSFNSCGDDEDETVAPDNEQNDPNKDNPSDGNNQNNSLKHEYVDLGLPSGTLWATYNIGATKPEEYGDYFAWGETEPKEVYDWGTYKYAKASGAYDLESITKYYFGNEYKGVFDKLSTLLPEDDAATANWGKDWRMPTNEEQLELVEECYWVWTNGYNGSNVSGHIVYKAKSTNDKGQVEYSGGNYQSVIDYSVSSDAHVFLPASGLRWDDEVDNVGDDGYYWSSSLNEEYEDHARYLRFDEEGVLYWLHHNRSNGFPVRAVRAKN